MMQVMQRLKSKDRSGAYSCAVYVSPSASCWMETKFNHKKVRQNITTSVVRNVKQLETV